MQKSSVLAGLTVCAAVLGIAVAAGPKKADEAGAKPQRAASVHVLMEMLVKPNKRAIQEQLEAEGAEYDFHEIEEHAAMLNESAYLLMDDGRCPDAVWENACQALREHSVTLVAAAKEKDLEATRVAFGLLATEGCKACHDKHTKDD